MDHPTNRQALEAILFVVDEPVSTSTLGEVLAASQVEVEAELTALAAQLEQERRGFVLRNVAGGWRFYTAPEMAAYVERWVRGRRSGRLSRASLETLAVIAYKQPVSRAEVGEIRGVNADGAMRTLIARGLIGEVGRDSGPGQAVLYGTTTRFLEDLGLDSLADLPPLTDFLPPGPAPDEPAPEHQRAARAAIRAGHELPSTGQARWEPKVDADETRAIFRPPDDANASVAAGDHRDAATTDPTLERRDADGELDALTEALELAARKAISALEDALRAVDPPTEPDPENFSHDAWRPAADALERRADVSPADSDQADPLPQPARRSRPWSESEPSGGWSAQGETDG